MKYSPKLAAIRILIAILAVAIMFALQVACAKLGLPTFFPSDTAFWQRTVVMAIFTGFGVDYHAFLTALKLPDGGDPPTSTDTP